MMFMQTLYLSQPNFIYLDVLISVRDLHQMMFNSFLVLAITCSDVTWQTSALDDVALTGFWVLFC